MGFNGVLNVYKEKGFTSHDVAAKLRGILKTRKTGHTGTLDPMAVGVLPVCIGQGTKLCEYLTGGDKEYVAELLLGVTTETEDITGVILSDTLPELNREDIISAVMSFEGEYEQIPPMYSAIKINGKKLYELAREGKTVERKPRPVNIREIEVLGLCKDGEGHPLVKLRVLCSKGTYIRTLCSDIGQKLGCGGTMASLVRTKAAGFDIKNALTLDEIEKKVANGTFSENLISVESVFENLAEIKSKPENDRILANGNHLLLKSVTGKSGWNNGERARVYDSKGKFYGVYEFDAIKGRFNPYKMFIDHT